MSAENEDGVFDLAVIGHGMLGSAAARYLAEDGASVCLIGSAEPPDRATHEGVFSSHYDSGRITRIVDRDPFYSRIAAASIGRYAEIEDRSGVKFFRAVGHLALTPAVEYREAMLDQGRANGAAPQTLGLADLAERFPGLQLPAGAHAIYEGPTAGYIDPRAFIRAQTVLAEAAGAVVVEGMVASVEERPDHIEVRGPHLDSVRAQKVLIATGAFANHLDVVPSPVAIAVQEHTVVFARLDSQTSLDLAALPSVIYKRGDGVGESVYLMPPIRYPDGNTYVKIGQSVGHNMDNVADSLQPWFQGTGDADIAAWLQEELIALLPALSGAETFSESCVVTTSGTKRPFIDQFGDTNIYALLAGNGAVAKSADELGRIAASVLSTGVVPHAYRSEDFSLRLA